MSDKTWSFGFDEVGEAKVEEMLLSLSDDTSPGTHNMGGFLLLITARMLSKPICQFLIDAYSVERFQSFVKSLKSHLYPKTERQVSLAQIPLC